MDVWMWGDTETPSHRHATHTLHKPALYDVCVALGGSVSITIYWDVCERVDSGILQKYTACIHIKFSCLPGLKSPAESSKSIDVATQKLLLWSTIKPDIFSSDLSLCKKKNKKIKNWNAATALPRLPRGLPVPVARTRGHRLPLIYLLFVNEMWECKVISGYLRSSLCLIHTQKEVIVGKKKKRMMWWANLGEYE